MSYTPTTWKAGDVITAAKLNKLEQGVQNEQVGPQGAPGADGSDGLTPTIGDNGNWFLGDTDTGKPSRGEAGPAGADGAPGAAGEPGAPGADGVSPTITENAGNSQTVYKLDVTTKDSIFTTPNLQAVSFVENAEVYSTEEQIVGRWIDGKPIYRKTVVGTAVYGLYLTASGNIERVVRQLGWYIDPEGFKISLPFELKGAAWIMASIFPEQNDIQLYTEGNSESLPFVITVEYTKTTDEATIAIPTAAEMTAAYDEGVQAA